MLNHRKSIDDAGASETEIFPKISVKKPLSNGLV